MFVKLASITNYFFGGQENEFISHSIWEAHELSCVKKNL